MASSQHDVLVIGAGVAGCATAIALAKQGRKVLLIERNLQEPRRIVGELLQPGGIEALRELGLEHSVDDIEARPVKGYHLYWHRQETSFWFCPTQPLQSAQEGRSFHHGRFVMNLRRAAKSTPGVESIEATASELVRDEVTGRVLGAMCYQPSGELVSVSCSSYPTYTHLTLGSYVNAGSCSIVDT